MTASKNEYRNSLKGTGPIPIAQGLYEESATAKGVLGQCIRMHDGRVFRYAKAGASALAAGKIIKAGTINGANYLNDSVVAAAIGAYTVTVVTAAAVTTGEEGYLQINDGTGEGHNYKIKSTKANASTATSTDVELYDAVAVALVASGTSQATILLNQYEACAPATAITDILLGVANIAVTAEYYFWLQTWGLACVLSEGTPAAGTRVELAITTSAGGVTSATSSDTALDVGIQWLVGVDTEYKPVELRICP